MLPRFDNSKVELNRDSQIQPLATKVVVNSARHPSAVWVGVLRWARNGLVYGFAKDHRCTLFDILDDNSGMGFPKKEATWRR